MSEPQATDRFIPYSAIGTNLTDIQKRRIEHDPTLLDCQLCWYLSPEIAAKLDPEVLSALKADKQPIEGILLAADAATFVQYRDRLPASIQQQIPAIWQLPADLRGYGFFACPLPPLPNSDTDRFAKGERMVLNGDGMVYRLGFEDGRATLKTRIMKTPCYYADLAAQLLLKYNKLGYRFLDGGMVRHSLFLGTRNQMNTAFAVTKEHLLVTFDAARPHIIDPDTLEILAPIGSAYNWKGLAPKLPPVLTQVFQACSNPAHPVWDRFKSLDSSAAAQPGGELVTVNFSAGLSMLNIVDRFRKWVKARRNQQDLVLRHPWGAFTDLIRYRFEDRQFEKWRLVLPNGEPVIIEQAIHQMALTEDYILIGDVAFKIELSQIFAPFLFGGLRKVSAQIGYWLSITFIKLVQPQLNASIYLVKRSDLVNGFVACPENQTSELPTITAIQITLPREVSHFVTDYDNPDGKITLIAAHSSGWDVTEWIGEYDESVNLDCEFTPPITLGIEKLVGVNKNLPTEKPLKCLDKHSLGMLPAPVDLNSIARYTIDAKTGAVLTGNMLSDAGNNPSKRNTWSVSVNTHRNLNRDSDVETSGKITNLYWLGWGFSWELIPKRIYRAYRERDNRVIPVEGLPATDMPACLLRLDPEQMEIVDSFEFPIGYLVRSPQFIPSADPCPLDRDPATHGYLVCFVMSDAEPDNPQSVAKDEVWIFHADDFKGKPIYRLSHPEISLGLMIHSTWVPELNFAKKYSPAECVAMRQETIDRDYYPIVRAKIFPHTKELFHQFVEPHYVHQTSEAELLKLRDRY